MSVVPCAFVLWLAGNGSVTLSVLGSMSRHISEGFRFVQGPSGTQVWSDVLEDLILPAASFALLAFLFLVALPFPEWLCPWLAAMVADAAAMLDVLFATLDATMFIGWIFQLGYGFIARDCFQHFCGGEALPFVGSAPAATENDFGYELEIPDPVSGAGLEYDFHEVKTSGLGAGSENDLFMELGDQVRRHAHPVGLRHAPSFQQIWLWVMRESPDKRFSGAWFGSPGMMTDDVITDTVPETVAGPSGMVLDGIFADTVPTVVCSSGMVLDGILEDCLADQDSAAACGDSSSAAASKHGICIGSWGSNKDFGEKKEETRVQFFVKFGSTSSVIRSSSHSLASDVLQLHHDEYAVCGSRLIKMDSTLSQNGIGNGSNVQVLRRLRGGAGVYLDIPGQWECKVCHATRCWPARKRCYRCDAPRDTAPSSIPMGPLGRAPPQSRSSGPPTRSSVPRHVPPRSASAVSTSPPGAGVGPSPGTAEVEKKTEASDLLQALSLLQRIMSPEDFVKYQVLVAPPKPGKTREQELADRVKSLQRLRTQETTHRGAIDKLELDLQRQKDMLQGVLSRIRVESEECDELRAQVAKENTPAEAVESVPPTQYDSQPDEMYLSTVEEESGDESMLMGGSTGAEDEMDVGRNNGIWERRRSAIIKDKRLVKLKDKDKLKNKKCKTIIIEEEKPPAPPDSGKHLAEVISRLSQDQIGVVLGHLPSSTVQSWVQSINSIQSLEVSSGVSIEKCG